MAGIGRVKEMKEALLTVLHNHVVTWLDNLPPPKSTDEFIKTMTLATQIVKLFGNDAKPNRTQLNGVVEGRKSLAQMSNAAAIMEKIGNDLKSQRNGKSEEDEGADVEA